MIGLALTVVVLLLGALAASGARSPEAVADALRALGTLMTLITGIFSAVWWHQSADLANLLADQDPPDRRLQQDSNTLNAAAATSTALALIAGVFTGLPWASLEGYLAAASFLSVFVLSSKELGGAIRLSVKQGFTPRSALGVLVLILAIGVFVYRYVLG